MIALQAEERSGLFRGRARPEIAGTKDGACQFCQSAGATSGVQPPPTGGVWAMLQRYTLP